MARVANLAAGFAAVWSPFCSSGWDSSIGKAEVGCSNCWRGSALVCFPRNCRRDVSSCGGWDFNAQFVWGRVYLPLALDTTMGAHSFGFSD
ncbi:MAG: hypothetical protein CBB71_05180 [Rhodopirellula sp. TMED11]|nr:MAG: hypothetical protein CBB71_05180 [Rhodopirellula sp. TMED11]